MEIRLFCTTARSPPAGTAHPVGQLLGKGGARRGAAMPGHQCGQPADPLPALSPQGRRSSRAALPARAGAGHGQPDLGPVSGHAVHLLLRRRLRHQSLAGTVRECPASSREAKVK